MGFNQNPHVAKATNAEQKAQNAGDQSARQSAWLEAAHQWERAAKREKNDKRATEYLAKADAARKEAEEPGSSAEEEAPPSKPAASFTTLN